MMSMRRRLYDGKPTEPTMYEISVSRTFAAAHAIRLPDGSLEPVHGHNWQVTVVVAADQLDAIETVMDFHDLEQSVSALTDGAHNRHLNEIEPFTDGQGGLAVNPTAERVAWWIGTSVARGLTPGVRLVRVTVTEAPGCAATYRP
jgi:6-pyruvoyltetrahydropterin/6-carboxytetrahydropterin synthase